MDELQRALKELDEAQAAWDDFKRTHYMPWQLDQPTSYQDRKADEEFRTYAFRLSDRVQAAHIAVIKAAQAFQA